VTLAGPTQPLAIRSLSWGDSTFVYVANDSPWPARLRLLVHVGDGCRVEALPDPRQAPLLDERAGSYPWDVELAAYGLVCLVFDQPHVEISDPDVRVEQYVTVGLKERIRSLAARAATLVDPPVWDALFNGDFEDPPAADGLPAGWEADRDTSGGAAIDTDVPYSGDACLRLSGGGSGAFVSSRPFPAPQTGRLLVSVWLRADDEETPAALRVGISGRLAGRQYERFAELGAGQDVERRLTPQWGPFDVEFPDLPVDAAGRLSLWFELEGGGDVWIDQVRLFDLAFSEKERTKLAYDIRVAELQLNRGELAACRRFLEGYWPRFLETHVPSPALRTARPPDTSSGGPSAEGEDGVMSKLRRALPEFMR
jgi:hypothetical protein